MGGVHPQAHSGASPPLWTQGPATASPKGWRGRPTWVGQVSRKGVGLKTNWGGVAVFLKSWSFSSSRALDSG